MRKRQVSEVKTQVSEYSWDDSLNLERACLRIPRRPNRFKESRFPAKQQRTRIPS